MQQPLHQQFTAFKRFWGNSW